MRYTFSIPARRFISGAPTTLVAITLFTAACSDPADPLSNGTPPAAAAAERVPNPARERIAFVSNLVDGTSSIRTMNTDGTGIRTLTTGHSDEMPSWSPDYTQIVFKRDGDQIVVAQANGKKPRVIGTGLDPVFSPDGQQIAYTGTTANSTAIFVMNADGTDPRQLTFLVPNANQPTWSPDGRRIAFVAFSDALKKEIFVMNADGTGVKQLTDCTTEGANCGDPDWSPIPGDDRVAYTAFFPIAQLRLIDANGDGTFVTLLNYLAFHPSWSRDGKEIAFSDTALGAAGDDIFAVDVATKQVRRLTFDEKENRRPAWSP